MKQFLQLVLLWIETWIHTKTDLLSIKWYPYWGMCVFERQLSIWKMSRIRISLKFNNALLLRWGMWKVRESKTWSNNPLIIRLLLTGDFSWIQYSIQSLLPRSWNIYGRENLQVFAEHEIRDDVKVCREIWHSWCKRRSSPPTRHADVFTQAL